MQPFGVFTPCPCGTSLSCAAPWPGAGWVRAGSRSRVAVVLCSITLAVAGATGCSDGGYPSTDSPVLDPFSMTQTQRLAAMNQVGVSAHAGRQWSYALLPGCTLRIDLDGEDGPMPSVDVPLLGSVIGISNDRHQKTFGVQVAPSSPTTGRRQSVLQSSDWADVSWMQLLLRVMQKGCDDGSHSTRTATALPRPARHHTTIEE